MDSFISVCKFNGDFTEDIENAKKYFSDAIKDMRYKDAGIEHALNVPSSESTTKLNINEFSSFKKIIEHLGFVDHKEFGIRLKFFRQNPGCIVPIHVDNFGTTSGKTKVKQEIAQQAIRVGIAMSDWDYGQLWSFGKEFWANWKIGDCVYWKPETLHGTANFGNSTRYNLQITGIPSQKTIDLINNKTYTSFIL